MQQTKDTRQLTWLLAWAVVFCDIGTSVYYVPGILYGNVGDKYTLLCLTDYYRVHPAGAEID